MSLFYTLMEQTGCVCLCSLGTSMELRIACVSALLHGQDHALVLAFVLKAFPVPRIPHPYPLVLNSCGIWLGREQLCQCKCRELCSDDLF